MTFVAVVLGGLGLTCLLLKRTVLGLLIGVQLLILGATTAFASVGVLSGVFDKGHIIGFFIVIGGVAQLAGGCALAVRLFYLKGKQGVESLESLKH